MKNYFIKLSCFVLIGIMSFSLTACGGKEEPIEENVEYDENGNPIVEEEVSTLLAEDSEIIFGGCLAKFEDKEITDNGIWLSESEVGSIADRYRIGEYKYEEQSFKLSDIKWIAVFNNIDNEQVSIMYFDENMDMFYRKNDKKYKISDPILKGLFSDMKNNIVSDSTLSSVSQEDNGNKTNPTQQQVQTDGESNNNIVLLSKQAFQNAGLDEATSQVLANSTFNLHIPVIKTATVEANTIKFTDENNIDYTLSVGVVDGNSKIMSIYNETNSEYIWREDDGVNK